jgi:toxin ParE1/3/4
MSQQPGKKAIIRPAATDDFDDIVDYYLGASGPALTTRFSEALNAAFDLIGRNPGIGSTRLGELGELPGLRAWPVRGFPHLIFYFERADHVDVWRILHGARDLGVVLSDIAEPEA